MLRLLIAVSLLAWATQDAIADVSLSRQQEQARAQRTALQERIRVLQEGIAQRDRQRQAADQALKASETAISDIARRLAELELEHLAVQDQLQQLQAEHKEETMHLAQRREELASQLRGQYLGNLSPWTALLSGNDPHAIGRNMAYLGYVSQAQARAVTAVEETLQRLQRNQQESASRQEQLAQLAQETAEQQRQLEQQRTDRQTALANIEQALRAERQQARVLEEDDQRLSRLIQDLGKAIQEQVEKERQARERARQAVEEALKSDQDAASRMRFPVQGPIQGRFGAARPEGGVWRGIVIRAPEGAAVRVIASGRVAYTDWLSGFGNIMIVDHGEQTMSVYAYNQGLLKQVGDLVNAGDVIATVGATGGQVESGLYFELRQEGKPINPELWLAD